MHELTYQNLIVKLFLLLFFASFLVFLAENAANQGHFARRA